MYNRFCYSVLSLCVVFVFGKNNWFKQFLLVALANAQITGTLSNSWSNEFALHSSNGFIGAPDTIVMIRFIRIVSNYYYEFAIFV